MKQANKLISADKPFAIAVVVRYEAPASAKPGDKALIQVDGKIFGWIGGGCTQPIVIKEAQKALEDGKPRFVRVTPTTSSEAPKGVIEYDMNCQSGGALDIYIEPVLPKPQLVIIGKSAVAQVLAKLAKVLSYHITVVAPGADKQNFPEVDSLQTQINLGKIKITPRTYIVVSTQGEYDEEALEEALKINAPYVAFVASKKKAENVFRFLKEKGVSEDKLKQLSVPAGLDIKAHLPEEIAVSILAEIIYVQRSSTKPVTERKQEKKTDAEVQEAKDPICGMSVDIRSAKLTSEYQGKTFYFCCAVCKQTFDKEPAKYDIVLED